MCILFIYRNPSANVNSYRLIIASNRDEYLKRPALPAHYWKNHSGCLGGIDMESGKEGGTWLGVSLKGRAGAILNLPNKDVSSDTSKEGRGSLITNFISSNIPMDIYTSRLHQVNQKDQLYNPYSLILLNLHTADVHYLNSSRTSIGPIVCTDNILGFGNSDIKSPYKKVEVGKELFKDIVSDESTSRKNIIIEGLLKLLKSTKRHLPDPELQQRSPTMFTELSSIFVSTPYYGTRTHTVLLVNGMDEVTFVEETLMPDTSWKRQAFNKKLISEV